MNYLGRKIKIKGNSYGFGGVVMGTTSKITRVVNQTYYIEGSSNGVYLALNDFDLLPITKEEIENEIKDLNAKIAKLNFQKQFMADNNLDEFDENQYKVFQTLKTLEDPNTNQMEKAKIIADLIQG